ncbi:MAG TPA: monofunctional biosynthetic peptidoglycan transglycosylase [Candidatus Polarisedimenticolia bacterium]|nr:monofunctional biosynthetic peptidoglycan transglycosylase [Candidatus Polarisedimenticolia bacterium]
MARLLVVLTLALAGYHGWIFWQVRRLRDHDPHTTAFMRSGLERLRSSDPNARLAHHWVPYEQISEHLKRAVIAGEDQRFLDHDGFDVEAIQDAYERNARGGRVRHGGSTISQQLAKNLFLSPQRNYLRKAQEALITMMIEHVLSKRRILEIYLNVIEWGDGIYGAEAAAQHYYGRTAADLKRKEAARLAAIIPSPRIYTRNPSTPYIEQRMEILLDEMDDVRVP